MPRYIPPALQAHLDTGQTTLTYLLRVDPVTPGFASYGTTELDQTLVYDDGKSELTYLAPIGMQPSAIMQTADLAVDNAEFAHLLPEYDIQVSEAHIRAGAYDFAKFSVYLVNYEDLSMGHVELLAGTIGQVSIRDDGLSFINELRSKSAELKQSVCQKDSLTCRAIFGSQPAGSSTPGPIERFPCGFDATSLLEDGEVASVGLETTITFTLTEFDHTADYLAPGIVKFLTGMNAGRTFEVSSNTDTGVITLAHDTPFPIAENDTLQYRRDCNKHARDVAKGCKSHWEDEWFRHFRGEPDIPIGDAGAMQTPGASSDRGLPPTYQTEIE